MTPALELSACMATAWQATPDMALRGAICAGLLVVAGWASARRFFPGKGSFIAMALVMAAWIGLSMAEHAAVEAACKGSLGVLVWGVMLPQPALLAMFLYQYLNSEPHAPSMRVRLLMAAPIGTLVLLAWTNGAHGLFYGPHSTLGPPIAGLPRLRYEWGPLFYVAIAVGYLWMVTALLLVLRGWRHAPPSQRGQRAAFIAMMVVPLVANAFYLGFGVRLLGTDPTSAGFATALVGFAWMVARNRLFAVVPMARERLFADLPDPVFVLDLDGRVVDANSAAQQLIAVPAPIGLPLASWQRLGAGFARLPTPVPEGTVLELADPRAFFEVQQRDIGTRGRRLGTLLQLHDVTDRELAHHEAVRNLAAREVELGRATALQALLREQAMHDPLTGLLNRRALDERWNQEARLGPPRDLTLVLLDIDHFKDINDTFGHAVGDTVLREFGAALRSGLRASDALFRVGGEEFALLMAGAGAAVATERVEALRDLVSRWRLGGLTDPVTFSAGVAEAQPTRATLESLLAAADKALYRAKNAGRDRIEVALVED